MVPLVVRANKAHLIDASQPKWEIIDGEQRWTVVGEEFDVSEGIPFVDAGDVSDATAKALTVSLNDLKGQHDTMALADVVSQIVNDLGMQSAAEILPYTPERMDSFAKLAAEQMGMMVGTVSSTVLDGGMATPGGGRFDLDPQPIPHRSLNRVAKALADYQADQKWALSDLIIRALSFDAEASLLRPCKFL